MLLKTRILSLQKLNVQSTIVKLIIMKTQTYITYHRTSLKSQHLGLIAQETATSNYINSVDGVLIASYQEQESGKNDNRIELEKAIQHCERTGAVLLLFKLDRLSRSVSFLFQLRDRLTSSNVEIKVMDMPTFNTMTLGIYATLAQSEREAISSRTRLALAERKKQGIVLGKPENLTAEAQQRGVVSIKANARSNDNNRQATAIIISCVDSKGMNYTHTANYLNSLNFKTRTGKSFQATTVMRLYQRYQADKEEDTIKMVA
jgi:DNA invertase Pin-like site-specific DNA recombinase